MGGKTYISVRYQHCGSIPTKRTKIHRFHFKIKKIKKRKLKRLCFPRHRQNTSQQSYSDFNCTYMRSISIGILLGTCVNPRLEQSIVVPTQLQTLGHFESIVV